MTNMPSFTDHISPEKQELLAMLLQEAGDEQTPFPLSFAQQRLWFLNQFQPDSPLYNMPIAVRLSGALNRRALSDSLNAIIARHEALRTTFTVLDEQPLQMITARGQVTMREVDLRDVAAAQQEAEAQRLMIAEARQPFDLATGPLLRALLLRLADDQHLLLLTLHHIIADGWSLGILVRELSVYYQARLTGVPPQLPALEVQYADYAQWQRDELQGEVLEEQLAYWRRQLAGQLPVLDLPSDHPRPAAPTFQGARQRFTIARPLTDQLKALCRQEGATLFMALLAAFKTLLYRYTGQTDLLVGTPVANRTQEAIEPLIGFFANTLVLRTDLAGDPSFRTLLGRVRAVTLDAYEHQDVPFEQLVEAVQPQRSLSHTPLFQVMFVLQNAPLPPLRLPELTLTSVDIESGTAKFDLLLAVEETEDGLRGEIEYSTELFAATTIARLAAHFQRLLAAAVADPSQPLAGLPLLTEAEQQQRTLWNATATAQPPDQLLHELVQQQAARTPDAVAVTFVAAHDGVRRQLTYRDLDQRANQLAHLLRRYGIGPDVPVGLCLPRMLDRPLALLAVLKAGGAVLPLDPHWPPARLAHVLHASGTPLVLTVAELAAQIPLAESQLLQLDQLADALAVAPTMPPPVALAPSNLAYVMYTSGSTGQPKGVSIDHRPLSNLVAWQQASGLAPGAHRTLQLAAPTFDVSLQEVFTSWATGSTLVLTDVDIPRDAERLLAVIAAEQIERLFVPFVALQQLAEAAAQCAQLPTTLREIITAGEQLQVTPQLAALFTRLPGCRLHNHYGPTESHVVSAWQLPEAVATWPALPPIGRPVANTQLHVLDATLRPVPIGVPGELHIGGAGLARGYLDQPALTAEKFVPDPFSPTLGARLYRTGDLVRYQADGTLEFLGRLDGQVKLRGFRIELGEIEATLRQHPAVREVAVTVREDTPGIKRLVVYVVEEPRTQNQEPETGTAGSGLAQGAPVLGSAGASELRTFLADRLPEYMVPSTFVWLDRLPVTRHGKVDRRALPAPADLPASDTASSAAPRTPTEEILAGIWREILRGGQIGVHDNFFALGGHSLLATQVITRIRRSFEVDLPLRTLFEAPTIAELAGRVSAARQTQPLPPIEAADRSQELPLSFAQERLWFLDQMNPDSATYNLPCYVRLHGDLDQSALERSLSAIVARHEALRTAFPSVDGRPVQLVEAAASLSISIVDLRHLPADLRPAEARRVIQADTAVPFNIRHSPLLRATLIRLDEREHVLLLTMHHIVSDAWSLNVLLNELATLYTASTTARDQRAQPLPALPVQYADYAVWQRQWLQGPRVEQQLSYWREQLCPGGTHLPTLNLPTDYPRPLVQTFHGATYGFELPRHVSEQIRALSREGGATVFMTLLAVWQTLLGRYSDQEDFAIGTPVGNRSQAEIEGLIGFFVNMLVLRADLGGNPSFRALLQRVRETALQAYAHQDLPFEQLVNELQPERDMSRSPLFQVMFALNQAPVLERQLPGLTMSPLDGDGTAAKFDLTLWMAQSGDDLSGVLEYNVDLFDRMTIERMAGHFLMLLDGILADPDRPISDLALLTDAEREQMLRTWNVTDAAYPQDVCIHQLIEHQAARTPEAVALIFDEERLSYHQLNERADRLAAYLQALGVRPGVFVGIHLERSIEMVVAILGVLKAGGAYLPLDPSYPQERLQFMVEDSQIAVLLTQERIAHHLPAQTATVVKIDSEWPVIAQTGNARLVGQATPQDLAYVIYTSGSTGTPKGVMVPHGTVINFFRGMDDQLGTERGTWLAVTSISFDISVLELLWTLARGFEVVIQADPERAYGAAQPRGKAHDRPIQFSLFYFSSDETDSDDAYHLLLEGAKFADQHGFTAVWTPERHFHAFGGLYPNPSVVSAAIAAVTERVQIRAGSVVLPLQHPIRVAEEWAVVDRLSHGRAGISFASGWHADDFVFAPDNYQDRKAIMLRDIETVRQLWRGEPITWRGGAGQPVEVRTRPRPIQPDLPVWITAGGSPETFRMAGEAGANLLTHLLGQSVEELAQKIAIYRQAWREHGHGPGEGHVTLMLHTFVGEDLAAVREKVRGPFTNYLRSSLDLIGNLARSIGRDPNADDFTEDDMEALLAHAFDRYMETSSLLGTPATCMRMIDRLKEIGVDELGCLIDFGVDVPSVLQSLSHLDTLRDRSNQPRATDEAEHLDYAIPAQMLRHGVTHLQCTPALARMLSTEPEMQAAFGGLRAIMLGGEAFPPALAEQLTALVPGAILNMYGPTETTIWSTVHPVTSGGDNIPIGRPIANTTIYILDQQLRPVPVGVPGDLYIGGAGVVRGYLQRPALTAERFIPDSFSQRPGLRLYKTGDQARYAPDGTIMFLGRSDQQVKLGGYRIELGEIEARLSEHPAVWESVVVVREDQPDEKYLAAYVVAAQHGPRALPPVLSAEEQRQVFEQRPRYTLPNGMAIARSSDLQANLSYQEIMIDEIYLKHGITINEGDLLFDVGANMGFFSMFVNQQRRNTTIYAFEPIPPTFDVLKTNVTLYGLNVKLFPCGLSDKTERVAFTFYPEMAGLSGRYSETSYDRRATKAVILSGLQEGTQDEIASTLMGQDLDDLLERQFHSEQHLCQLRRLSEVIQEQAVERIDLLKIDVERAEVDVLRGIDEADWAKIKQVVLEVDTRENLDEVGRILVAHGFRVIVDDFVVVEAGDDDPGVYVYMLYATRASADAPPAVIRHGRSVQRRLEPGHESLATIDLRAYLKERLPEYMVPSSVMVLPELPRTPNGKLDRKALPAPTVHRPALEVAYVAPSSELEQTIADIWRAVLHVEQVGVHDSFFELGGTSLLIVQARTKLRDALGYDVSLVDLFRYPTISTLAEYLGQHQSAKPSLNSARARAEKQVARRQRRTGRAGE